MKAYLDSDVLIYLVEQPPQHGATAATAVAHLNPTIFVGNKLTRLECLVIPRRKGDAVLEKVYADFFTQNYSPFIPIDDTVYDLALDLRAKYVGLKTPDAIHLATAIHSGCDVFVTNDYRLIKVTEIRVVRI